MSLRTRWIVGLTVGSLLIGTVYAMRSSPGTVRPDVPFEPTTVSGVVFPDADRTMHCTVFLSGPVIDMSSQLPCRLVVVNQDIDIGTQVTTRLCLNKSVDPFSSEAVTARYTSPTPDGMEAPLIYFELMPRSGLTWKDVQEFEDLSANATRVQ